MRGYDIKITPVKDDRLWRIVEISDRQTLHQLSGIVRDEFSLTGNHLYCFYLGDKPYNARTAYGGPAADTRRLAVKTTLGSLGLKKGRRFLYVFDFADDRIFRLQVQRIHNVGDPSKLPRVTKRHGQVARPSRSSEETKRQETLAELGDMSERLGSVADSWSQGKRPSKASLRQEYELATELGARIAGDWEKVKLLEKHSRSDVSGWLIALPEALAAEGLTDEALAIIDTLGGIEPDAFLGDKPLVLCKAGRGDEARKEAEANAERFPEDAWIWAKGGDVFWKLGDTAKAESFFRRALELAGNTQYLRESVLERLLALLEEMCKSDAARDLAAAEQRRRARSER